MWTEDRPWPPTRGFYIYRKYLGKKPNGRAILGPAQPCVIWSCPFIDPDTGEEMDRGEDWQALVSGYYIDVNEVWPWVAAEKITVTEYDQMRRDEQ